MSFHALSGEGLDPIHRRRRRCGRRRRHRPCVFGPARRCIRSANRGLNNTKEICPAVRRHRASMCNGRQNPSCRRSQKTLAWCDRPANDCRRLSARRKVQTVHRARDIHASCRSHRLVSGQRDKRWSVPVPLAVTDAVEHSPAISRNDRWLAYVSGDCGGLINIRAAWSADSQSLTFISNRAGQRDLYAMPVIVDYLQISS